MRGWKASMTAPVPTGMKTWLGVGVGGGADRQREDLARGRVAAVRTGVKTWLIHEA